MSYPNHIPHFYSPHNELACLKEQLCNLQIQVDNLSSAGGSDPEQIADLIALVNGMQNQVDTALIIAEGSVTDSQQALTLAQGLQNAVNIVSDALEFLTPNVSQALEQASSALALATEASENLIANIVDTKKRLPYGSIAALRSFLDTSITSFNVTTNGLSGLFTYDSTDTTSADDGFSIILQGTRRFKRAFEGYVKPEMFGAKGDGVADDYQALQKSATWLMSSGGGEFILTGKQYLTSGQIIFRGYSLNQPDGSNSQTIHFLNNKKVAIVSPARSSIKATATMPSIIKLTYNPSISAAAPFYSTVEDILLDGGGFSGIVGIMSDYAMHTVVRKCSITGVDTGFQNAEDATTGTYGVNIVEECSISANTCIKVFAGDCNIHKNDLYPYILGIYMGPISGNTKITKNIFNNEIGSGLQTRTGIEMYGVNEQDKEIRNVYITENEFYAIHTCIKSNGNAVTKANYQISITNNHAKGGSHNWAIVFIEAYNSTDFLIQGNFFGNVIAPAVGRFARLEKCERFMIKDNNIQRTTAEAIFFADTTECEVSGNIFRHVGSGFSACIILYGSSNYNHFEHNRLYNYKIGSTFGYYFLNEQDTSNYNTADHNIATGINRLYNILGANSYFIERINASVPPTTGFHTKGSITVNPKASPGAPYSWLCTTSGDPGTWKIISTLEP